MAVCGYVFGHFGGWLLEYDIYFVMQWSGYLSCVIKLSNYMISCVIKLSNYTLHNFTTITKMWCTV